jgi:hypothetical protein
MLDVVHGAEVAGTDTARLDAFDTLAAMVSWLNVPLADPVWRPRSSLVGPPDDDPDRVGPHPPTRGVVR